MCWQQLLVVWIHCCVSMECGFLLHKVNLNPAVYHRIKVSISYMRMHLLPPPLGSLAVTRGPSDSEAPLETVYPDQCTLLREHLQLANAKPPLLKKPWEVQMHTPVQESVI